MKANHLLILSAFTLSLNSYARSSAIPDRREFPVNTAINPCTDFYGYACSKVMDSFELREDRSRHIFSFSDSAERILEAKKKFLKDLQGKDPKKLTERSRSLRNIYVACMNEPASKGEEKALVGQMVESLKRIPTREVFLKFLGNRLDQPEFSFIRFGTESNLEDPLHRDIFFLGDLQTLPERSYYSQPKVVEDLEDALTLTLKTVDWPNPKETAHQIVELEKKFTETYPLPADFRDLFNKKTQISREKLIKKYPEFSLNQFLERIPKNTLIRDMTPANFKFVQTALRAESLDLLKAIYLVHALPELMDDAYPEVYKKWFDFKKNHLGGPNERPVREERCTNFVMESFERELDAEMLPILFPGFPKDKFIALAEKVRASILKGLQQNPWLSHKTKAQAIEKIQVAFLQLVAPTTDSEWDFNPKGEYSDQTPHQNKKTWQKSRIEKEIKEYSEPRDPKRWEMGPLTVNAYYSPPDNKFVMPIGILQYPFYDPKLSEEANLGAVGVVIGHELGHGIDDKGSRYDSKGRLHPWMSKKDLQEFERRGSRMIQQFEKVGHNGKLTLGENIGDLVGLTFAYQAAFPKQATEEEEKKKNPQDKKKEFFTQYARVWCGVMRPKEKERRLKTDPHALVDARVNEQVKHQPGFAEAFSCKAGDAMMLPADQQVRIW